MSLRDETGSVSELRQPSLSVAQASNLWWQDKDIHSSRPACGGGLGGLGGPGWAVPGSWCYWSSLGTSTFLSCLRLLERMAASS